MTKNAPQQTNNGSSQAPVVVSHHRLLAILFLAIFISAISFYFFQKKSPTSSASQLPNIIFIIADDIGWSDYGFNHHPFISTPNIDELAHTGVVFNNAYAPNSICRPSLASIITGLYPAQHGITANTRVINVRRGEYDIGLPPYAKRMDELYTIPRALSKLGYRSLQAGKWWEEGYTNGGFDEGDKKPQGLFRHVTRMNVIGREGLQPIFDFIDNNKEKPFFIWYAPQMPHTPHNPPSAFLNNYLDKTTDINIAKYWGMVSWFDDTIGQIVAHLQTRGLRENTIIIYMSDNGVSLQSDIENTGSNEGKDSPYEMGVRTPIIFNWPTHWQPTQRDALISNIDIFPTLMELLKTPTGNLSGVSILSTITHGKSPERNHASVNHVLENYVVGEGYVDQGKEVFDNPRKFRWIRYQELPAQWKLIAHNNRKIELFNLTDDPNEQHNLADDISLSTTKELLLARLNDELPDKNQTFQQQ